MKYTLIMALSLTEAYANFAGEFLHNPSWPYHSQANGLTESTVKTAEDLIRKTNKSSGDVWFNFLDYRNTPTKAMDSSSAQQLMSRRTQTYLVDKDGRIVSRN